MLAIDIPGFADLRLQHLVLDYNGTLAVDGALLPPAAPLLRDLAQHLQIHVITADTFGRAKQELGGLPVELELIGTAHQAEAKRTFVTALGCDSVVAIGNGRNDRMMLEAVALAMVVTQREGAAQEAIASADVVLPAIDDALELLRHPLRLTATLRS